MDEVGNGYGKQYLVDILVDENVYGNGRDYSIKGAEQQAAEKALQRLDSEDRL